MTAQAASHVGATKRMWFFLLKEGGRWCSAELSKALGIERKRSAVLVGNMAEAGMLRRYEKAGPRSRVRYAVTTACKVPSGITVQELTELGVLRKGTE